MAAISSRNATAIGGAGTTRSEEGLWSYAVPTANETSTSSAGQVHSPQYVNDTDESREQLNTTAPPLHRAQSADRARSIKSTHTTEQSRLSSGRSKALARKVSDITGSHSSKAESLLQLYTQPAENIRSSPWPAAQPEAGTASAIGFDKTLEHKWIHRDKLAQIENREMRQAGLKLGLRSVGSRLTSQVPSAAGEVVQEHEEEDAEALADAQSAQFDAQDQLVKRQRTLSPSRSLPEDINEDVEPSHDVDAESQRSGPKRSTSKIPVSRGTSGPSPDPDSPGGRSRTNSNARGHTRNASSGNAFAYTGPDGQPATVPTQGRRVGVPIPVNTAGTTAIDPANISPTKGKTPPKKNNSTSAKTAPGSKSPGNSKATNTSSGTRRPSESEGSSRPSTAVAEVEPPWISSMFKPDPRLPPDQQMLPTHAKKLAQEQGYTFNDPAAELANPMVSGQSHGVNGEPTNLPGVPAPPYSQIPDQQQSDRAPTQYAPPHIPATNTQNPADQAFVANPTTPLGQQTSQYPSQAPIQANPQIQTPQQLQAQQQQPVVQPQVWTSPQDQNGNLQSSTQGDGQQPKVQNSGEPGTDGPQPAGRTSQDRRRGGKQSAQGTEEKSLPRLPDAEENEKSEKKGCGCCVVM